MTWLLVETDVLVIEDHFIVIVTTAVVFTVTCIVENLWKRWGIQLSLLFFRMHFFLEFIHDSCDWRVLYINNIEAG